MIRKHKDLLPHFFRTYTQQINDGIDAKGHGLAVKRGTVTNITANTDRTQDSYISPLINQIRTTDSWPRKYCHTISMDGRRIF